MRLKSVFPQVHVVLPQPGSNNAHRVDDKNKNKNIKVELVDKAQIIEDVPFAKEIFQVIILQTYEHLYFFEIAGPLWNMIPWLLSFTAWGEQPAAVQPDLAAGHPAQEVAQLGGGAHQLPLGRHQLATAAPPHGVHPRPLHLRASPAKLLLLRLLTSAQASDNGGDQLDVAKHGVDEQQTWWDQDGGGLEWRLATSAKKTKRTKAAAVWEQQAKEFHQVEPKKPSRINILTSNQLRCSHSEKSS